MKSMGWRRSGIFAAVAAVGLARAAQAAVQAPRTVPLYALGTPLQDHPEIILGDIYMACQLGRSTIWIRSFCQFDTGGAGSRIRKDAFSTQFPVFEPNDFHDHNLEVGVAGTNNDALRQQIWLPWLALGGVDMGPRIADLVAGDAPFGTLNVQGQQIAVEAQLGLDALLGQTLDFRFGSQGGALTLDGPAPAGGQTMARDKRGRFVVPVSVGTAPVNALFDTGAELSLVDEGFVKDHPDWFVFVSSIAIADSTNQIIASEPVYRTKGLKIGGVTLDDAYFASIDLSKSVNLKDWRDNPWRVVPLMSPASGRPIQGAVVTYAWKIDQGERSVPDAQLVLGYNVITRLHWFFDLQRGTWSAEAAQ